MKEELCYGAYKNLQLYGSLYKSNIDSNNPLIIYLHGGGLIYGNRDDLPVEYINNLVSNGFSVLTLDYPLVPEIRINIIIECLIQGISYAIQEINEKYILFGRSAGAFLALQLANSTKIARPQKIISFYGYYSLEEPLLLQSSDYYRQFQIVPYMTAHSLIQKEAISQATIESRFPIYLSFRQTGNWVKELLGRNNKAQNFSLTEQDLKKLPPTFIAASQADQDVPFSINKSLSELIPDSETFFVNHLPHDFDANTKLEEAIACYEKLITWLDN